jgi:hypothetical protein
MGGGIYRWSEWAPPLIWRDNSPNPGKAKIEMTPIPSQPVKEVGSVGPTLVHLGPGFVPCHPLVSYYLWLCLILDILKICIDFGSYDAFPSSDVPEMINQQNSWNSLVISTYLLYPEWNLGILVVDKCILWPPTRTHQHGRQIVPTTRRSGREKKESKPGVPPTEQENSWGWTPPLNLNP